MVLIRTLVRSLPVMLKNCPPGLFIFKGRLGFKTEYGDENGSEAFCASGEYFWGGTRNAKSRGELMVVPVCVDFAPSEPGTAP